MHTVSLRIFCILCFDFFLISFWFKTFEKMFCVLFLSGFFIGSRTVGHRNLKTFWLYRVHHHWGATLRVASILTESLFFRLCRESPSSTITPCTCSNYTSLHLCFLWKVKGSSLTGCSALFYSRTKKIPMENGPFLRSFVTSYLSSPSLTSHLWTIRPSI